MVRRFDLIINVLSFIIDYQGIVTVQYYEDELGYIKLIAQPSATLIENEHSSNEEDTSEINDSDNILRQSVQFVSINNLSFCQ